MKLRNLTPLSLTLALCACVLACEGGISQGYTAHQSAAALNENQSSQYMSKSQARKLLAHALFRIYGISECRLDEFKRISIESAIGLISEVTYPEEGQAQLAAQFLQDHSDQIVALLGTIETDRGPTTLLRLVYQPSLSAIPDYLSCSDGILFDLTSPQTDYSSDVGGDSPRLRWCWEWRGSRGRCCNCVPFAYQDYFCHGMIDFCHNYDCCSEGPERNPGPFVDEYCPGSEDYFLNDDASIGSLEIGASL